MTRLCDVLIVLVAGMWLMASAPALADDITPDTSCRVAVKALDALNDPRNRDRDKVSALLATVGNVFSDLDDDHMRNGEDGIVAEWTDKANVENELLALESCRSHPDMTIGSAAARTYVGLRALERTFGGIR